RAEGQGRRLRPQAQPERLRRAHAVRLPVDVRHADQLARGRPEAGRRQLPAHPIHAGLMPVWILKLTSVIVTLASVAGFWHYVTAHVHPVKAPLKPHVVLQPDQVVDTKANTGWDLSADMARPTPTPVVKTVVVVQGAQQQVQGQAALGANWVANRTGQKPVVDSRAS